MYTHTGECPYVCGVNGCQLRFKQNGKLSLHRRTHPEYALKHYHLSVPRSQPSALDLDNSRRYKRQDTGPTLAQAAAVDENPACSLPALPCLTGCLNISPPPIPQQSEALQKYLDHLDAALTLSLRPMLPLPPVLLTKGSASTTNTRPPNLSELMERYPHDGYAYTTTARVNI